MRRKLKKIALATGLYRPARLLHRALTPSERHNFQAGRIFYDQFVCKDDLCFDIGANVGEKTEILLSLGASVISVEPQPELAREIRARVSRYGRRSLVIESAVGDRAGMATLHLKDLSGQASLLTDWEGEPAGQILVSVSTLDDLIEIYGIPKFIKIDVEGFESRVLRGLSRRISLVTIEYHGARITSVQESINLLRKLGPIEINATGGEAYSLLFHVWLSAEEFLERFPDCIAPYYFGDLIIREKIPY